MAIRNFGLIAASAVLGLVGCGDAGNGTGSATQSGTDSGSASIGSISATTPTESGTDSGSATEGSGSVSMSGEPTGTATMNPTEATTGPNGVCGDGTVDPGEQCDDGPGNGAGQTCNANCTANTCGDGVLSVAEECDLGPNNGMKMGCSNDCKIEASTCGNQTVEAELMPKPIDIIIAIDNSGSMDQEIEGIQDNININFAQILEASGLDYRVIMVARHGSAAQSDSVCVEAPLSGIPQGGCAQPPPQPVNAERFFHYSVEVASHDSWCKLINNYSVADEFGLAPGGWREWLRPDAFKVFLEFTDDGVDCGPYDDNDNANDATPDAMLFDTNLRALDPTMFGETAETRNYKWYSVVAMAYNNPPEQPYTPADPLITGTCPTAAGPGTGYQALSIMTEALRFPLCDTSKYDVVFQAIANGVINDVQIACDFDIPDPPPDTTLNEESIVVLFTPAGQMNPIVLMKVPSIDQCNAMSFYVEDGRVYLCPEACTLAQADKDAKIEVEFTCDPLMPN